MTAIKVIYFILIIKGAYIQTITAENQEPTSSVIASEFDTSNIQNGQYKYNFFSSDGTSREESGGFDSNGYYVVTGYYSYIDEFGKIHHIQYSADKDGYHPVPQKQDVSGGQEFAAPAPIVAALLG